MDSWKHTIFLSLKSRNATQSLPFRKMLETYNTVLEDTQQILYKNEIKNREKHIIDKSYMYLAYRDLQTKTNLQAEIKKVEKILMEIYKSQSSIAEKYQNCKDQTFQLREIQELQQKEIKLCQEKLSESQFQLQELKTQKTNLKIAKDFLIKEKKHLQKRIDQIIYEKETLSMNNSKLREKLIQMIEDHMNRENEIFSLSQAIRNKEYICQNLLKNTPYTEISNTTTNDSLSLKTFYSLACVSPTKCVTSFKAHAFEGSSLIYNSSGNCMISSGNDKKLKVWDSVMFNEKDTFKGYNNTIISMSTSLSDDFLIAGSSNGCAYIWSYNSFKLKHTLIGHAKKINGVGFLWGGQSVLSASEDRTVKSWEINRGYCTNVISTPSIIYALALMPSEKMFLTGHFDGYIRMHMDKSIKTIDIFSKTESPISSLSISPCSNYAVAGLRENNILIIDLRMHSILHQISDRAYICPAAQNLISFSKDSRYVVAGSYNGDIIVLDTNHGTVEKVLKGVHKKPVISVQWSPYGNHVPLFPIQLQHNPKS
ncbi:hypothetical protein SteCoe_7831 [Stentor coeruleus]|uniref:Uncharacterized protein n=1 Tax=Stentor coeruleus TaxID=5963 RepID=A0A1R2CLP7_9CILI|nr:hypothetical protein SteCoe_7831 [Stentor coeruleus]